MEDNGHGAMGGLGVGAHHHPRGKTVVSPTEIGRLQHLLHRIEQVLNFFPPGVPSLDYTATTRPAAQCFSPLAVGKRLTSQFYTSPAQQQSQAVSQETTVTEDEGLLALSQLAFDAALARLVAELIRTIPSSLFHPKEIISPQSNQPRPRGRVNSHHRTSNTGELELGTRTLQLVQEMVCRWYWTLSSRESLLPLATTSALRICLSDVDGKAYEGLKHAAALVEHAAKLSHAVSGKIHSLNHMFVHLPFVKFSYHS